LVTKVKLVSRIRWWLYDCSLSWVLNLMLQSGPGRVKPLVTTLRASVRHAAVDVTDVPSIPGRSI
jgi:hypothetical protein